ncbi:putative sperm motility kinase W [Sciurus carolinensis]|uniref:putative sperm motility kinase W n=1 Tax=Sciurus carolinensis TaxID=30640 RepID=UPI001FB20611|nr:putative sperm motility kinase W [Sciurus carolinensis]
MLSESSGSESSAGMSLQRGLSASSWSGDALAGQYRVLGDIGQGSFGTVRLARHILTETEVAVKVLGKGKGEPGPASIGSEVEIMKAVEHPNVVQLFQVLETTDHIYVVMEYAGGGQLQQHVPEGVGLQEEEAQGLFLQVASALHYCHEKGIAHRDVKAENILLDGRGHAKLCDFGLGRLFTPGERLDTTCGTPAYWAPELFLAEEYDGPAVDVWSLGVLLYFMLTGRLPFPGTTVGALMEQVLQGTYDSPGRASAAARSLVAQMLTVEAAERPKLGEVLRHRWLSAAGRPCPSGVSECAPVYPDPLTVTLMLDLGYGLADTWRSLKGRKFDAAMATYLLLRHLQSQGTVLAVPRRRPRPSSSSGSLGLPKPCQRRASEPSLYPQRMVTEAQQRCEEQRACRRASLPAVALRSLQAGSLAPGGAPPQDLAALPPSPGSGGGGSQEEAQGALQGVSRGKLAAVPTEPALGRAGRSCRECTKMEGHRSPQGVSRSKRTAPLTWQAQGGPRLSSPSSPEGTKTRRPATRRILSGLAPPQDLSAVPPGPGSGGHRSQVEGCRASQGVSRGQRAAFPTKQAQAGTRASSREGTKTWRRVTRRILAFLARVCCCCCLEAPRTESIRENRVAPTSRGRRAHSGRSRKRVAPESGVG